MLDIAIGVIGGAGGPYLMEVRPDDRHLAGLLAFPGGKCRPGESAEVALHRELREEVGLDPATIEPLITIPWQYPEHAVRLHVYRVTDWTGAPAGQEGQVVRWCDLPELLAQPFPPANRGILLALQLPESMIVSAACAEGDDGFDHWLSALRATLRAVPAGSALVQLRPCRSLSQNQWQQALALVADAGLGVVTNRDGEAEPVDGAGSDSVGVHLSAATLMRLESLEALRQAVGKGLVTAAAHNAVEIEQANRLGVDALVVSPVLPTRSHPDAEPLGWPAFSALASRAQMPVYGLGGLTPSDAAQVRQSGGQGIAAIRAFWSADHSR